MGGKSHAAVTFPLGPVLALDVVNPRLTAWDHTSSGWGLPGEFRPPGYPLDQRRLRHSCNTWRGPCR